jgi:hypothetical protein
MPNDWLFFVVRQSLNLKCMTTSPLGCYTRFPGPGVSVPPGFPGSTPDDPLGLLRPIILQVCIP